MQTLQPLGAKRALEMLQGWQTDRDWRESLAAGSVAAVMQQKPTIDPC